MGNEIKDLSFISIENQQQDFPQHYHETFCISLIKKGVEKIQFDNQFLYSQAGEISITNPFEVHRNPIVDKDCQLSFETLYISQELMAFFSGNKKLIFKDRQIYNPVINGLFFEIINVLKEKKFVQETILKTFIEKLRTHCEVADIKTSSAFQSDYLKDLIVYIERHIEDDYSLNKLAQMTHENKYGFSRKFKAITGMTPMHYVTMKKIFSAKNKITADVDITSLAYNFGFTDLAHFSKVFKKYIGVPPRIYQKQNL